MSNTDDRLDALLADAFALDTTARDSGPDRAKPRPVSAELRARILQRAAQASGELLARRLREAGKRIGWSLDDLAEEATVQADQARSFLRTGGDPSGLLPRAFARLFWRTEMPLADWQELLLQTIAAYTVFQPPMHGEVWGRTHGLTGHRRAEALSDATKAQRDPDRAEKVARGYVEEVVEEWTTLKNKSIHGMGPDDE